MQWIPEIPTFRRAVGKDGKERLYILANNSLDIDAILSAAGLRNKKITYQNDKALNGYYCIIRKHEEKFLKKAGFDI